MWDIPRETHRYFLEPISKQAHIRFILMKRFLRFIEQIENSSKSAIKSLLSICRNDCNSITGKNLRNILLLCNKNSISSLSGNDIDNLTYNQVPEDESWRIDHLNELLNIRSNSLEVPGFTSDEITDIINIVCTS